MERQTMNEAGAQANILIVDDKPENLLALEAVLQDLDQRIVRAYTGREALRCLLNEDFAVILLDVNMPGMDGFETAGLIRGRPSSQHIPIIFITAFGDDPLVAKGYSLGAVDYLTSPFAPEVLRSKVGVFVSLYQMTAQTRRQSEALRRRAGQLQMLSTASIAINSAPSVEQMIRAVTDYARELIGSHFCGSLILADPLQTHRPSPIRAAAAFSDRFSQWRNRAIKLEPVAGTIIAQSPIAIRLSESELREHPDWEIFRKLELPTARGGLLAAPLSGRDGKNLGLILLMDRGKESFSSDDEAILVQLAQITSIAIQNIIFAQEREANRIKDEFLATLSHELRTPLNAIVGWTQILRTENLPDDAAHGLDVIERNVKAQTKLIEDLLDVSRVSSGKMRLQMSDVPLEQIVQSSVDAIRPAADAKNIQLELEIGGSAKISGDPDRLQQVVWNLLANAVKFTPPQGQVHVRLECVNHHAQIQIADTGQGIDGAFLPFVFDRFRQADNTMTRSHGGLGIGLTIVRHIVELHGGSVAAHSPGLGSGATFTVTLPTSPFHKAPSVPAVAPKNSAPHAVNGIKLSGKKVLVIDDEPDALELIREILSRAEAKVTAASSVREAMECMGKCMPHVLVSDIAMPGEDGFQMIQMLRQLPAASGGNTPAIALTAYAREEDRIRALTAGFQMHLTKPVEPQQLIAAVARLAGN
jgi:signal transduction histidine kinase/DNA-binding response OmpR family regulator